LRGQLIHEIIDRIGEKIPLIVDSEGKEKDRPQYLDELKAAISKYEAESKNKFDQVIFNKLSFLLLGWNRIEYASVDISLNELSKYVEGHEDSLFIDRIEVYLSNVDLPDDVVLVDLPGLGVKNPRHIEFTKEYIRKEAKAFVVCMKPKSLIEGDEAEFLIETSGSEPTILTRSFWLINQWDSLTNLQKEQEERNFYDKLRENSFQVSDERCFKVSALRYSLLYHLIRGTLKSSNKRLQETNVVHEFFPTLPENIPDDASNKAKELLEKISDVRDFETFRTNLFEYLNLTAKKEFLTDAKSELMNCILELTKHLSSLDSTYQNPRELENELKLVKSKKEADLYFKDIKDQLENFVAKLSKNILTQTLWNESSQSRLEKEIDNRLTKDEKLARISHKEKKKRGQKLRKCICRKHLSSYKV